MDLERLELVTFNGGPVHDMVKLIERCAEHGGMPGVGVPEGDVIALYEWCEEGGHYQHTATIPAAEWEQHAETDSHGGVHHADHS